MGGSSGCSGPNPNHMGSLLTWNFQLPVHGGERTTVFLVEKYDVRLDKLTEYAALLKKFDAFAKKRPDLFKGVKSHRVFRHMLGGSYGGCIEMTEMDSLADVEKFVAKAMADKEFMTKIYAEFMALIVTETYSANIWTPTA